MRISIQIEVTYDEATVDDTEDLIDDLERNIAAAIGIGLLDNDDKSAVVDEWDCTIKKRR